MIFRAAVLHEVGKPPRIETVEAKPLQPHGLLVRVRASGLCDTDLEVMKVELNRLPAILGHEGVGIVARPGCLL